jgi:primosomal protein N'
VYIFSFKRFAGFDRVFKLPAPISKTNNIFIKWNLIKYYDDIFLCLWDDVSFKEQYTQSYIGEKREENIWFELICTNFISDQTIAMIHWMVYRRYSTYKSVMRYFIPLEIDNILNTWKPKNKKTKIKNTEYYLQECKIKDSSNQIIGQQLIIFPDIRSLFNILDEKILSGKWNIILSSNDTQNQKNKKRRMIKNGEVKNVFCTHSEIFQDRNNLKKIILIDPYKRYYENQQDPRYSVPKVVKKMQEIYEATVII